MKKQINSDGFEDANAHSFTTQTNYFFSGDDCWRCKDAQFCSEADEEESDCGDEAAAAHYVRLGLISW